MAQRQFTTPWMIRDNKEVQLFRVPLNESTFNEGWLQDLLFRHPSLLPIDQLESVFAGAVSLCREMESGAGPVDVVLVNQQGFIVIVETKLWRNHEARRTVVAQIIDYTKGISKWSY